MYEIYVQDIPYSTSTVMNNTIGATFLFRKSDTLP